MFKTKMPTNIMHRFCMDKKLTFGKEEEEEEEEEEDLNGN
jgi:hypothetical protein